ncbi:MAG TPA: nucleotide exchange factor GrpE [Aggregatilineales bacterium]|nr:nucleotide exchange factor GrpE [Anaerolineales bacterium]HRE48650.1 nucleotide exchange factor GrpE [Aggregatilineales bacterium]
MMMRGTAISGSSPALKWIEALMPVVDGIEKAIESGTVQLTTLADPTAHDILSGWLEGQRVLLRRLLDLFEREGVRPIPAVGQPFDPRRHRAVEAADEPGMPAGVVVAERRRGYQTASRILRFAEVVVSR